MGNNTLRLSRVSKSFDGVPALSDVSLDVAAGSVHGLIGQNGAGKSTLIKVLAGLHRADSGQILIDGIAQHIDTPKDAQRLGIEIVHQDRLLGATQSVAEVLALGNEPTIGSLLRPFRMRRDAADAIQRHFGVALDPSRLISTLSVAEQQIVQITRALSRSPRILVFDEPTAALSAHEAERLFRTIERLKTQGLAILYVSHYLDEIHALCDQLSVLRDGANVAHFTVADSQAQQWLRAMIGTPPSANWLGTAALERPSRAADSTARLQLQSLSAPGRFDDISLQIHPGEIVGITGLLGAGGKEVVRSLFGLEAGISGRILINGQTFQPATPRAAVSRGVAFIPEDRRAHGIALDMPVRNNMTLASLKRFLCYGRIDRRHERKRVQEQIDALRIVTPGPEAPARHLSGGNQQKVVLAKWLDTDASLYLLDEPTVGIDINAKQEVYQLLARLAAEGAAILLYSTDLIELLGHTDRILVMARGRIVRHVAAAETDAHDLLAWASGAASLQQETV